MCEVEVKLVEVAVCYPKGLTGIDYLKPQAHHPPTIDNLSCYQIEGTTTKMDRPIKREHRFYTYEYDTV